MSAIEDKIRALLNLAGNTNNPHEADAFHAKAEDLMVKYSLSASDLTEAERGNIGTDTVVLSGPYVKRRLALANRIALANNCFLYMESAWGSGSKRKTVGYNIAGHSTDRMVVNLLFASLDSQMLRLMPAGSQRFRSAYINAFCNTVAERIGAAERTAQRTAGTGLVPVSDVARMKRWVANETGLAFRSSRIDIRGHAEGSAAGNRAGNRADVGNSRLGQTKALNR